LARDWKLGGVDLKLKQMKKIMIMLAFCGTLATMTAQATKESDGTKEKTGMTATTYTKTPKDKTNVSIPEKIRNRFTIDFPDVKPVWKREMGYYTASYKTKRKMGETTQEIESVAIYDKDAKMIRTESEIDYKDYPLAIVTYYETQYPNGAVYKVWQVENKQDGTRRYYSMHEGRTTWFDWEGKYVKDYDDWHHGMQKPGTDKPLYK